MIVAGYRFKPKLWTILITALFVAVFISLGNWQLSRADEKKVQYELLEQYAKQPPLSLPAHSVKLSDYQYREIEIFGEYLNDLTIFVDNKIYQGRAGYHIVTPFKVKNSKLLVAVNRGWLPVGDDRRILPEVIPDKSEKKITGTVISPEIRALKLSKQVTPGIVWDNFNLQRYQEITGLEFQPLLVLLKKTEQDGLIRDWHKPDSGATKNFSYAMQWFSLALTTLIIFIVLNVKRSY